MNDRRRKQASDAGFRAAQEGKSRDTCKRQRGTIYFDDWHDGFDEGAARMSEKREVVDLETLSDDAKGILGAWFSLFGRTSTLDLQLQQNVPHPRTEAALAELVEKRVISVEPLNRYGGLRYRAVKDCHPALAWLHANADRPDMKFPLMVPA